MLGNAQTRLRDLRSELERLDGETVDIDDVRASANFDHVGDRVATSTSRRRVDGEHERQTTFSGLDRMLGTFGSAAAPAIGQPAVGLGVGAAAVGAGLFAAADASAERR